MCPPEVQVAFSLQKVDIKFIHELTRDKDEISRDIVMYFDRNW